MCTSQIMINDILIAMFLTVNPAKIHEIDISISSKANKKHAQRSVKNAAHN